MDIVDGIFFLRNLANKNFLGLMYGNGARFLGNWLDNLENTFITSGDLIWQKNWTLFLLGFLDGLASLNLLDFWLELLSLLDLLSSLGLLRLLAKTFSNNLSSLRLSSRADVVVQVKESLRVFAVDGKPPLASEVLLVENGAVGAEEALAAAGVADVEHLAPGFNVSIVACGSECKFYNECMAVGYLKKKKS